MNKTIYLTLAFLFTSLFTRAQLIDNSIDVWIAPSMGTFGGNTLASDGAFTSPSFYSNFSNGIGIQVQASYKWKPFLSAGIFYDFLLADNWSSPTATTFENSQLLLHTFAPLLKVHSPWKESGLFNRLRLNANVGPSLGWSQASTDNVVFTVNGPGNTIFFPESSNDMFYGARAGIGVEYSVFQFLGVVANYTYETNWVDSYLYTDKNFTRSQIVMGVVFKLKKKKDLYY